MAYKAHRPSLKRPDPESWTTGVWDWIRSIFWLLFLVGIVVVLSCLAYQAVMTEMDAAKPGSKVGLPK